MKLKTEFWILKQTWNRNILRGPFERKQIDALFEAHVYAIRNGPEARGGPIKLSLLKMVEQVRIVRRGGGLVGTDRTPKGRR